jgi:hypothetical protein
MIGMVAIWATGKPRRDGFQGSPNIQGYSGSGSNLGTVGMAPKSLSRHERVEAYDVCNAIYSRRLVSVILQGNRADCD